MKIKLILNIHFRKVFDELRVYLYVQYGGNIDVHFRFFSFQQLPKWWIWLYYLGPSSWILNAQFTSQYGNIDKEINVFGETKTVVAFLNDYFGFHQDRLSIVATIITAFPIVVIILYTVSVEKLNFQKR
jgi:hypothetical protein